MPPPYVNPHLGDFSAIPHVPAGPVGYVPLKWVSHHSLIGVPVAPILLPNTQLTRAQVMRICRDPTYPVLFGYVCAMAWGLQGAEPRGFGHVVAAWGNRVSIEQKLLALRAGGLTRRDAYNLFTGGNGVPGLGPAYFTKLLYFFGNGLNGYIMDQWSGKSVNLLTATQVVRMSGNSVSNLNKGGNYQAFCEEVDAMASLLRGVPGDQVEEMMMSRGGRQPWPWRAHVRKHWPAGVGLYNRQALHANYSHIPLADF